MKRCPKCAKVYDDSWRICLQDSQKLAPVSPGEKIEAHSIVGKKFNHFVGFCFFGLHTLICFLVPRSSLHTPIYNGDLSWAIIDFGAIIVDSVMGILMLTGANPMGGAWTSFYIFIIFGGIQWYFIGGSFFRTLRINSQKQD